MLMQIKPQLHRLQTVTGSHTSANKNPKNPNIPSHKHTLLTNGRVVQTKSARAFICFQQLHLMQGMRAQAATMVGAQRQQDTTQVQPASHATAAAASMSSGQFCAQQKQQQ
jgi:hypothetical protein